MSNKEKMIEILKQHNIKIEIGACGCCGSPWVSFEYNGEKIIDNEDDFNINMFDDDSDVVCSYFNSMETFKFGKYKGLTYEKVRKKSPSYFTWLWFNIKEKLDKPLYDYIEANLKELKKEADSEHAAFMYDYCNGEVAPEY